MKDINDIRNSFGEFYSISKLLCNDEFEKNLKEFNALLKSKYKINVYNDKEIKYVPYSIFLEALEDTVYEKLHIKDNTKLEVEITRIIKKTKDERFKQLLFYVKNYIKEEEINEIKDLIVKVDLSKNIFPVFFKNLNNIYNIIYAETLSNNEKLEENKGKIKWVI